MAVISSFRSAVRRVGGTHEEEISVIQIYDEDLNVTFIVT